MAEGVTAKFVALALVPREVPPVDAVYHFILLPDDVAFKFEDVPRQMDAAVAVTDVGAEGNADTVTVIVAVLVHPVVPLVTV